jgi:hypothetical protein
VDLAVVEHGNGDVSIGFESEGVFVPVAGIAAHRIEHYKERAATLSERLEDKEDAAAQDAVDALPITSKKTRRKSESESTTKAEGGTS